MRHLKIAESTWHRWVARYGGMKAGEAKRLKETEAKENQSLGGYGIIDGMSGSRGAPGYFDANFSHYRPNAALFRPRLVQMKAAALLTLGMAAVPTVPIVIAHLLPEQEVRVTSTDQVVLTTEGGTKLHFTAPTGWEAAIDEHNAMYRSGQQQLRIRVYDRDDRDVDSLADRVMRADRLRGLYSAFKDAMFSTPDGGLTGPLCVSVTENGRSGDCAFLADDTLVVSVQSSGTLDQPAAPLETITDTLSAETKGAS